MSEIHLFWYNNFFKCGVHYFFLNVFVFSRHLSWRDVQHIIARTARPGPVALNSKSSWIKNKAGLRGMHL